MEGNIKKSSSDESKKEKRQVPVAENLFTMPSSPDEESHMMGSRCNSCSEVFFPKQNICPNCSKEDMEELILSRRGQLYSYTVVRQRPSDYKGVNVPYALGQIELPERVRVTSLLVGCDFDKLKVGMQMEMVIEKLYEDEEGNDVMAYMFKPV
ncbi:MAG: Zn-ribbon domain-containing OB-fold protein [Dehalococcoidia bacterium]|nr:Zn-ribbon domain-containing OB-fold protein [Dehalococcoidia bacterium]